MRRLSLSKNKAIVIALGREDFQMLEKYFKPEERYTVASNPIPNYYLDYPKCRFLAIYDPKVDEEKV